MSSLGATVGVEPVTRNRARPPRLLTGGTAKRHRVVVVQEASIVEGSGNHIAVYAGDPCYQPLAQLATIDVELVGSIPNGPSELSAYYRPVLSTTFGFIGLLPCIEIHGSRVLQGRAVIDVVPV